MTIEKRSVFSASDSEVAAFGIMSGDMNDIHIDEDYAADSMFGERVVHGVYTLGWVSSLLADLPVDGDVVLTGLDEISFQNPVYLDEPVEVICEYDEDRTVEFTIKSKNGLQSDEELKTTGTASVFVTEAS